MSDIILDPLRWESVEAGAQALLDGWLAPEGDHIAAGQVVARALLVHRSVDTEGPQLGMLEQISVAAGERFGRGQFLARLVRF